MRALLKRFVHGVVQVLAAIVLISFLYLGWAVWETTKLRNLCRKVSPGMTAEQAALLVEQSGFSRRWIDHRIEASDGEGSVSFIPAASSMGEGVCEIRFGGSAITSARTHGL